MTKADIQRQYDEVIAPHYDLDPLAIVGDSLGRALAQVTHVDCLSSILPPLDVLDVGIGTGTFCERLRHQSGRTIHPHGLDISRPMIEIAVARMPDLVFAVDDAARLDHHFGDKSFDLVCTHFVTGFIPLAHLAPKIHARLKPGGCWSFVGGTSQAFPELRRTSQSRLVKLLLRGQSLDLRDLSTPVDQREVVDSLRLHDFEIVQVETFEPTLRFKDFQEFMSFAWRGGWLTPFIEQLGLHKAGPLLRALLNALVFPVADKHRIVIALARKSRDCS